MLIESDHGCMEGAGGGAASGHSNEKRGTLQDPSHTTQPRGLSVGGLTLPAPAPLLLALLLQSLQGADIYLIHNTVDLAPRGSC